MTWGQLRQQLVTRFPGLPLPLINNWLQSAYEEILASRPWQALEKDSVFVTAAPYIDGTVTATQGSATVTGAATGWGSGLASRLFRVVGQLNYYTVLTVDSATQITLDRPYEEDSVAGAGYSVFEHRYTMPAAVKRVKSVALPSVERLVGDSDRFTLERLNPSLAVTGPAEMWSYGSDDQDGSDVAARTVILYPVPDRIYSLAFVYEENPAGFTGTNLSDSPLSFVAPDAIVEGASRRALRHLRDYQGAREARDAEAEQVALMGSEDNRRRGPSVLRAAPWMVRHRASRWLR